jgi:hypothetical protein
MKILTTLLTLSLLVISATSFAVSDDNKSSKKSNIPVAPSVWEGAEIEVPELLKFIKAKNAFVPVAGFVWGDPSEAPGNILMVPVAPFVYGESTEKAPEELKNVKYGPLSSRSHLLFGVMHPSRQVNYL